MIKAPNPIDKHVGARVRMRRLILGMSQGKLGEALDVTFQQVQKYEKGANRVGASRLQQIADVIGVQIPTLFDGAPTAGNNPSVQTARFLLSKPHSLRLVQGFDKLRDEATRLAVLHLIESIP